MTQERYPDLLVKQPRIREVGHGPSHETDVTVLYLFTCKINLKDILSTPTVNRDFKYE